MNKKTSSTQHLTETIRIQLDQLEYDTLLDQLHTHFTENAPTMYYNKHVIEVENYHTKKRYSSRGEEDMDVPIQKRLQYRIEDGASISIDYQEPSNTMTLSLEVSGANLSSILNKATAIRDALVAFIHTRQ